MTGRRTHTTTSTSAGRSRSGRLAIAVTAVLAMVALANPTAASAAEPVEAPTFTIKYTPALIAPAQAKATATITGPESMTGYLVLAFYASGTCTGSPIATKSATITAGKATVTLSQTVGAWSKQQDYSWRASYGDPAASPAKSACMPQLIIPLDDSAWKPFATASELVVEQFKDFVGRAPGTAELDEWTTKLIDRTATPGDLIEFLRSSADNRSNVDPAARLYRAYFLRNPDAPGLRYWATQRRKGMSLDAISDFFARSSEFKNSYGTLGDDAFVSLIYKNILGRNGDPGGLSYWTNQLNGRLRTRGQVMVGFSESPEYTRTQANTITVAVMYALMLGRQPTATELETTVTLFEATVDGPVPFTVGDLGQDILKRGEYLSKS